MGPENSGGSALTRRQAVRVGMGSGLGVVAATALDRAVRAQTAATPLPSGALTATAPTLTVEGALAVLQAALAKARALGVAEVVAVLDAGGNLTAYARMDGAYLASIDLAQDKAYTALSFHQPTDQFAKRLGSNAVAAVALMKAPRVILLGGGAPLMRGTTAIGGVGCSGGTGAQDQLCAAAGVAALPPA